MAKAGLTTAASNGVNTFQTLLQRLDDWQRQHRPAGFIYAVIKKYGDDEAGYQAALLTYYGFLSLFPLLLVLTTVVDILAGSNPHLKTAVSNSIIKYFPALGNQLAGHIGNLHRSGLGLVIGLLGTFYGARGVADAFRHGVSHIWHVPKTDRLSFPKSIFKSLTIIVVGGLGFMLATVLAGYAATAGRAWEFKLLSVAVNVAIPFGLFTFLIMTALPLRIKAKQVQIAAIVMAVGLAILESAGSYIVTHQMKNLSNLYSNFAVVLGLLFWLYLQSQLFFYALEVTTVRNQSLWPRSLTGKHLTDADKQVYTSQATEERMVPQEEISVDV